MRRHIGIKTVFSIMILLLATPIFTAAVAGEAGLPKAKESSTGVSDAEKTAGKGGDKSDQKDRDTAFSAKDNAYFPEYAEKKLSLALAGKTLNYTAVTSMTPIFDDEGEEKARIFSTSYLLAGGDRERPVTFLFNGGPGSASVYLHAASFAPKAFPFTGTGVEIPRPPFKLVENPDCLLDATDLVFVDPVGTGFSYALPPQDDDGDKSGGKGKGGKGKPDYSAFWGIDQDIDSITEFIRVWLEQNDRWGARLVIGGESYGGLRAAGLAASLAKIGAAPSGVILISPATSYVGLSLHGTEDYSPILLILPTFAATAQYHRRLAADLQNMAPEELTRAVSEWGMERFLPALWKGNRLPPAEYDQLVAEYSRYTGLSAADVKANKFRLDGSDLSRLLLRDQGQTISLYDSRLTGVRSMRDAYVYEEEPLDRVAGENIKTGFMRYLSEDLGLKSLRKYHYSSSSAGAQWDFTQGAKGRAGYPSTVESLALAMRRLPYLKVYLAMGRYDLVTPAETAEQGMTDLDIPGGRAADITRKIYAGGHMMYTNPQVKKELAEDLRQWLGRLDD